MANRRVEEKLSELHQRGLAKPEAVIPSPYVRAESKPRIKTGKPGHVDLYPPLPPHEPFTYNLNLHPGGQCPCLPAPLGILQTPPQMLTSDSLPSAFPPEHDNLSSMLTLWAGNAGGYDFPGAAIGKGGSIVREIRCGTTLFRALCLIFLCNLMAARALFLSVFLFLLLPCDP